MNEPTGTRVGTVLRIWRYPVKSMAGEPLTSGDLSWAGLAGDRRWAFVRPGAEQNGFPWHTMRELPSMCRYVARLDEPQRPDKSPISVSTPTGTRFRVTDPALAAELGAGVRVMRLDRGLFDAMPVSLITSDTVSALSRLAGVTENELRFRPNLVISPASGEPYTEDQWVGCELNIGDAVVRIDRRDTRCVNINVNPRSGQPDAALLKLLGQHRQTCAGVYGTTVKPGLVQVGDRVSVAS